MNQPDWSSALDRAAARSPFLSRAMDCLPALVDQLAAGQGEQALAWAHAAGEACDQVAVALRREKQALALALAIGDLAGAFPLLRVTQELSDFADRAMDRAIADAIRRRAPDAEPVGFLALALGKHGARELNYSSDIDPILLYDPERLPRRERDDPGEAAQRVARALVETLAHATQDGYVFRVDLRLRPASEVSPLAIPLEAALTHYESSALAWERAAFIRARACAGDVPAGEAFLAAIRPFIWRKSLDFGAIAEVGRLTAQIRSSSRSALVVGPGFDLKKGRGGIREIEFYAQTHQLIHGGRLPALRCRGTRETLDALAQAGIIGEDDARMLGTSYDRLRTIEHRLQMVADQQTHSLPTDPEALDSVARLDGLPDGAALVAELAEITDLVGSRYDALIAAGGGTPGATATSQPFSGNGGLAGQLAELGFSDPAALAERIAGWSSGRMRALRSDAARVAFDAIQPQLLAALARAPEPDEALLRWERLLGNLPSAINLFHLLEARPALLELLARILSLAPLADELARRADMLDPLIDASAFDLPGDVDALVLQLADGEAGDDYERVLDRVRRKVSELRFTLGVQLIEGATDPLAISAALARVAEAAIRVLADAASAEFRRAHGTVPDSELVVLGLGRMGGGALARASDLDLVFLFTGNPSAESDGRRPLGGTLYYNRLCQRVIAALSVPTAEGALFEVDTRLRPSGEQGPIAVSFDSFSATSANRRGPGSTWRWRARGRSVALRTRAPVSTPLLRGRALPRDAEKLRADVLEMRARMAEHKPPKGPLDAKLARGGLVDLEFLIHYVQLREHAGLSPDLRQALGSLIEAGLLPPELASAHDALARLLVAARLLAPDSVEPPKAAWTVLARACGCADRDELLATLQTARHEVAQAWSAAFGEQLEIGNNEQAP